MKWIRREKIKVDRVACPWLVRNFVDSEAEFVFLQRETEWEKIDNADDAKNFASIPLANLERLSLTGVAYSIHHLTCKQDSRD